jgi:Zn-dependent protease with chaperone function
VQGRVRSRAARRRGVHGGGSQEGVALDRLVPTRFHRRLRDAIAAQEPGLFRWYSSDTYESERDDRLRLELLRSSYRLSPESHERPHRLARVAAAAIGVEVPIVLYQLHQSERANAGLCFAGAEAHVVLSGPLLAALDDSELTALFGHELAHHRLFTLDDGTYRVAAELIEATAAHAGAAPAFVETALRNRRWTEIFADRGAAIATGAIEPAIACLVKVGTGLAQVSAADYLAQAREVIAKLVAENGDRGETHPENAVRAVALELWNARGEAADDEIAAMIEGVAAIEALDLVEQREVSALTRRLLDHVLAPPWMRTDATLAHARRFFADYEWTAPAALAMPHATSLHEYFAYILLDFAVVDATMSEVALARALVVAGELGLREPFAGLARKELKSTAGALAQLEQRAHALFEAATHHADAPT